MRRKNSMRKNPIIPAEILTSIDVLNTLGGGVSEPAIKQTQFQNYRQVTVRIPGVPFENMKVEINNNQLMIHFHYIVPSQGQELQFKRVVYNKSIPYFVDTNQITAIEDNGKLVVRMPFNKLASGQHRDIAIVPKG